MRIPTPKRFWNLSILYRQSTGRWLRRTAGVVFVGLIFFEPPTPDSIAGHGAEPSMTSLSSSQTTGLPNNDGAIAQGLSIVPKFVPGNLSSPDPSAKLCAPDHWGPTNTKIPLKHSFEAMEVEDEAVRARAAAIIDQQWAIERYLIDLTFSTRGSDSGELMINTP